MSSFTKKRKDGFTIIEVMIVLAIAGLIMLIVFLAVPALQRTARNTTRKADASAIAAAVASYIDNNGGQLPSGVGYQTDTSTLVIGTAGDVYTGGTTNSWGDNTETAKLGYYVAGGPSVLTGDALEGDIWIHKTPVVATPIVTTIPTSGTVTATAISTNDVLIIPGVGCNSTNTQAGALNPRTVAIFYVTETGSGNGSIQCLEQ